MEAAQDSEFEINVWVVLGGNGQLGRSFGDVLNDSSHDHQLLGRGDLDVSNREDVEHRLSTIAPDVIINCAAWTAVDDAEDHKSEAHLINAEGARNVARVAHGLNARLVQISTDYVFAGNDDGPYLEHSSTNPVSVYGASKLAGEEAVLEEHNRGSLVVRTAWLYSRYGSNFVKTMVRRALSKSEVRVVNDQFGQPTNAGDLARHVVELVENRKATGVFHGTNSGSASWYDLTVAIYRHLGVNEGLVNPVDSSAYPTKARRPRNSVLGHNRTLEFEIEPMRSWDLALSNSIESIVEEVKNEVDNGR